MNEHIDEQLSALMDGELERDQTRFVLRRASADTALPLRWERYHVTRQVLRRQDVVVLRHGRIVADRATVELHPDDVIALMAGVEADTSARRQITRLRSLVDQLAEEEPSASIPLIVSALSTALGVEQMCVHLLDAAPGSGTSDASSDQAGPKSARE